MTNEDITRCHGTNIDAATAEAKKILTELAYLMTPEGATRADAALLKYYAENTATWEKGAENGASMVRFVGEGDARAAEAIKDAIRYFLDLEVPLPYQLRLYVDESLKGRRPGWARKPGQRQRRGNTGIKYRDLVLAAAVFAATQHGIRVMRSPDMRDEPDVPPSACSIVRFLVQFPNVGERTVEDAWSDHKDAAPDPLTQARIILSLIR